MFSNHSYKPDYFSIIDIAASEERVLCVIEQDIPKLGFLDSSSDADDLKAGSKLELPFWVAKAMLQPKNTRNAAPMRCELSKIYKQNWRDILKADSSCVVLSKWNQYYYEFGLQLVSLPNMQKHLVIESLLQTFKCRYRLIMDHALNPMTDCMIPAQLPALERELFKTGSKYYKELINWIEKGTKKMETANVITNINLKKRKRAEMELD